MFAQFARPLLVGIACFLIAGASCGDARAPDLAAELGAAVRRDPPIGPRLSIPTTPACEPNAHACRRAPAAPPPAVLRIAREANRVLEDSARTDALHASALVDLIWGEGGISIDRSIESLRSASRLAARPAPILTDLAAALSTRAARTGSARDLFAALDAAEEALRLAPGDPAVRYNAALAADALGLSDAAEQLWTQAAAPSRGDEPWSRLARRGRAARTGNPAPDAQRLRELAWDRVLGEWGAAVARADGPVAARALARADSIARVLRSIGGDASLEDAVREIRRVRGDAAATRRLARGHRAYARARADFEAGRHAMAADTLAMIPRLAIGNTPLRGWAMVLYAAADGYQKRYEESERELDEWSAGADTLRHPALAGRGAWIRSTVHLRTGRYESALSWAQVARQRLVRAGERENAGAAQVLALDAASALGDAEAVYTAARSVIATLQPFRGSVRLHNALGAAALHASTDRMHDAALRLSWEGVRVASRTGGPHYLTEAHLVRARVAASAGHTLLARTETSAGRAALVRVDPGQWRDWLTADLQLTRARVELSADPLRASQGLDSAFTYFASMRIPLRALPLLVARGEARLASGDKRGAADLERAAAATAALGRGTRNPDLAASLLEAARPVFDRAVVLRLAAGDTTGALLTLERGRPSLQQSLRTSSVDERETKVVYAVVGDTLLAWVLGGGEVRLHRGLLPRRQLAASAERLRWALERRADAVAERELGRMSRWLLHPIERWLGRAGEEITLVADGELASLPFAALATRRGTRWVEEHPLRRAASLADAAASRQTRTGAARAVLVADPAFDEARHPGLARLAGARREVEEVARGYTDREILSGAGATRHALLRAVRSADILHFAGHAMWDPAAPARSWLLLAPGAAGAQDRLSAEELGASGLAGVRLVVLSSCRTVGSGHGRMGGFAGFARSLIGGGAGGVVASLWRVDDRATRALMGKLHDEYRASGEPAEALRAAQLALIRSHDPKLRAPSAWAGFVYAGS